MQSAATPMTLDKAYDGASEARLLVRAQRALRKGPALAALLVLSAILLMGILAPLVGTVDPAAIDPGNRLKPPSSTQWFGTDALGRDSYSRVVYGARVSLIIGFGVTAATVVLGLLIGVAAGYFRAVDAVVMRIMDGVMAIPGVLLAIALVALSGASLGTVMLAITIPEVPRVARLVRGVILTVRTEPFVEAAV